MKLIIYTLTPEGEVPSYVLNGGYYATPNGNAEPQDYDLIGLAKDEAPEDELADVREYLIGHGAESWVDFEGNPFDLDASVAYLESL